MRTSGALLEGSSPKILEISQLSGILAVLMGVRDNSSIIHQAPMLTFLLK